jgi:hypothetical protein
MNVMIDFFNSSGLLTTLTDAADGNVENITEAIPGQDEFEKMALNYLPTAQEQLQAITGECPHKHTDTEH